MAVVVIGGQASGVGKTSAICGLIAAMPERRWTAIKITQCSHQGGKKPCDCELYGNAVAMSGNIGSGSTRPGIRGYREEHLRMARTDSYRYLEAGAVQSFWVRTLPGHLGKAMPRIEEKIARGNVVIESNSVMEFLRPEIYALIVSPDIADFKPTALRYLERADAILMVKSTNAMGGSGLSEVLERSAGSVPRFSLDAGSFVSPELVALVRSRLDRDEGVDPEL